MPRYSYDRCSGNRGPVSMDRGLGVALLSVPAVLNFNSFAQPSSDCGSYQNKTAGKCYCKRTAAGTAWLCSDTCCPVSATCEGGYIINTTVGRSCCKWARGEGWSCTDLRPIAKPIGPIVT